MPPPAAGSVLLKRAALAVECNGLWGLGGIALGERCGAAMGSRIATGAAERLVGDASTPTRELLDAAGSVSGAARRSRAARPTDRALLACPSAMPPPDAAAPASARADSLASARLVRFRVRSMAGPLSGPCDGPLPAARSGLRAWPEPDPARGDADPPEAEEAPLLPGARGDTLSLGRRLAVLPEQSECLP